ncbi:hypothetical protein HYT84_01755 [Candidatus Micrarchaeota archaeon]|nr:hypothetical protein [Candidatus Micrarchaeota archaeon]
MTDVMRKSVVPVKRLEIETSTEKSTGEWNQHMEMIGLKPNLSDKAQIVKIDGGYALYFTNENGDRRYIGIGDDEAKMIFSMFKKYGDVAKALRAMEKNFDLYEIQATTRYSSTSDEPERTENKVSLEAAERRLALMALANVYSYTRPDRKRENKEGPWEVDTLEYRKTVAITEAKAFLKIDTKLDKMLDKLDAISELLHGEKLEAKTSTIAEVVAIAEGMPLFKGMAGGLFTLKALQEDYTKLRAEAEGLVNAAKADTLSEYTDFSTLVRDLRGTKQKIEILNGKIGPNLEAIELIAILRAGGESETNAVMRMRTTNELLQLKRFTMELMNNPSLDSGLKGRLMKIEEAIADRAGELRTKVAGRIR